MATRHVALPTIVALLAATAHAAPADPLDEGLLELRVRALAMTLQGLPYVKALAATCLVPLGSVGEEALLLGLGTDDPATREACARALASMDQHGASVVPALLKTLDSARDNGTRDAVVRALLRVTSSDHAHLDLLLGSAHGRGPLSRCDGIAGLALAPPNDASVRLMVAGLTDPDERVRNTAIRAIGCGGCGVLEEAYGRSSETGWQSFWEDERFAGYRDAASVALLAIVRTHDHWGREHAVSALARASTPPGGCVDALLAALRDQNEEPELRARAAGTLATLVERGHAPVEILAEMLERHRTERPDFPGRHEDIVRYFAALDRHFAALPIQDLAAETAWRLGPKAGPIVPALRAAWERETTADVAGAVAGTLGRLGCATDEMIAYLAWSYASRDPSSADVIGRGNSGRAAAYLASAPRAYAVLVSVMRDGRKILLFGHALSPEDAIRALTAFPEKREETARLLRGLEGASWEARFRALETLELLGLGEDADRRELAELLATAPDHRRWDVIKRLGENDPEWRVRILAVAERVATKEGPRKALWMLPDTEPLPAWATKYLRRRFEGTRIDVESVLLLGNVPGREAWAEEALARAAQDSNFNVRGAAGQVLARRATAEGAEVRRVLEIARGAAFDEPRKWQETFGVLEALASDPGRAKVAIKILESIAIEEGGDLEFAVIGLEAIARDSPVLTDARIRLLEQSWDDRYFGAVTEEGLRDRRLLRFMVPRLLDPDLWYRGTGALDAVLSLAEADDDRRKLALTLKTIVLQPDSKRVALEELGRLGGQAKTAVPAVQRLVSDPGLGEVARETLRKIG